MSWKRFSFGGPLLLAVALALATPDPAQAQHRGGGHAGVSLAALMNSAEELGPHWALATLLIGAVSVLLLLGIKESGRRHSTNGSAAPTREAGKKRSPKGKH